MLQLEARIKLHTTALLFIDNYGCLLSPMPSLSSGLFCEHPPPMVLLQTSPCDQYECQNGAQCIVVQQEPTCRCPPGFAGPRCEKLITVNFVGKDSYVELASAKVRPQANISLQVCMLFSSHLPQVEEVWLPQSTAGVPQIISKPASFPRISALQELGWKGP